MEPALEADEAGQWIVSRLRESPHGRPIGAVDRAGRSLGLPRKHRLLIVDDDRSVRGLLRKFFEGHDRFELLGEDHDGREAIALARHHNPDLVLLDLAMPGMGGLEALPLILAVAPQAKIVVLSGLQAGDVAEAAIRHGAAGYLTKGATIEELLDLLEPLVASAQGCTCAFRGCLSLRRSGKANW